MEERTAPRQGLVHDLKSSPRKSKSSKKEFMFLVVIMIALGLGTGYIASNISANAQKGPLSINEEDGGDAGKGETVGVTDEKQFPDTAEGKMVEGGIDGEGQYHLERSGGESQNVYLTSSTVDLSQFIGKNVKVWGQTFEAQKAGWLMDVGGLQVK